MARLEWKEVEAPDFRGASAGYLAASKLFGEAIESARSGLDDFQKQQSNAADNAVLNGLMAYQGRDPKELEAAMQDGSFMAQFDPNVQKRMSAGTRQTLLTRPADLLAHAVKSAEYGEQQKAIAQNDVVRANQADINTYTQLQAEDAQTPGSNKAGAFLQSKPQLREVLSVGNFNKVVTGGQDIYRDETSNRSSAFDYGKDVTGYTEGREATDLTAQLRSQTESIDDVDQILNGSGGEELRKKYSPQVIEAARRNLVGEYGGGGPAGGGSAGSGAYAGNGSVYTGGGANAGTPEQHAEMASALGGFGFSNHVVAGALGNSMIEGGYAGGMGDGGTAAGHFQWRGDRQKNFQRVIGKPVAEATPADSAKFFKWEFDNPETSGAFVKNKDGTTPVQQRDMILNAPNEKVAAELIDKYYERSDGKARGQRISAASQFAVNGALSTGLKSEVSGDQASDATRDWEENWSSKTVAADVARDLSGEGKTFMNEDPDYLTTVVKDVMALSPGKINAATAGAMLKRHKTGKSGVLGNIVDATWFGDGVHATFDWEAIRQEAKLLSDPKALAAQSLKTEALGQGITDLAAAKAAVKDAETKLAAKRARAQASGKKLSLADEIAAVDLAKTNLAAINKGGGSLYDAARGGENQDNRRGGANPRVVTPAANPKKKPATPTDAGAKAVSFLERELQAKLNAAPPEAGPAQIKAIQGAFEQRFGITMAEAKKDPDAAARAVRRQNARVLAAQKRRDELLASAAANKAANFSR
jgi:hypothetical protein